MDFVLKKKVWIIKLIIGDCKYVVIYIYSVLKCIKILNWMSDFLNIKLNEWFFFFFRKNKKYLIVSKILII